MLPSIEQLIQSNGLLQFSLLNFHSKGWYLVIIFLKYYWLFLLLCLQPPFVCGNRQKLQQKITKDKIKLPAFLSSDAHSLLKGVFNPVLVIESFGVFIDSGNKDGIMPAFVNGPTAGHIYPWFFISLICLSSAVT